MVIKDNITVLDDQKSLFNGNKYSKCFLVNTLNNTVTTESFRNRISFYTKFKLITFHSIP